MERMVRHEGATRTTGALSGTVITRYKLVNDDDTNYLNKAQSYFTKDEKKQAKMSYKLNN